MKCASRSGWLNRRACKAPCRRILHSHGPVRPLILPGITWLPKPVTPVVRNWHLVHAGAQHSNLSPQDVEKLRYVELQAALAERKLSTLGKKHELVDRLKQALVAEQQNAAAAAEPPAAATDDQELPEIDGNLLDRSEYRQYATARLRQRISRRVKLMAYKDIVQQLGRRMLNASGRKPELVERLAEAKLQELEADPAAFEAALKDGPPQGMFMPEGDSDTLLPNVAATPAPRPAAAAPAATPGGSSLEEILQSLETEPYARLRQLLQQRGLPSAGRRELLVNRLAQALLQEREKQREQAALGPEEGGAAVPPDAQSPAMLILDLVQAAGASAEADDNQLLLRALYRLSTEQLRMVLQALGQQLVGSNRQQLLQEVGSAVMKLAAMRESGRDSVLHQLEEQAVQDRAALDQAAVEQVVQQQAKAAAAKQVAQATAPGSEVDARVLQLLGVQLERMSLVELMNAALDFEWDAAELARCTLPVARSLLQDRCRRAMSEQPGSAARAKWVLQFVLKRMQRRLMEPKDPPTCVTLLLSATAATATTALETVRYAADALHTRPDLGLHSHSFRCPSYFPQLQQELQLAQSGAGSGSGVDLSTLEQAVAEQSGARVRVVWVEEGGLPVELPLEYVLAQATPEGLLAEGGSRATKGFDSLEAMASQLASQSGAHAVLPVLLGTPRGNQRILEALEAAGVAVVGTPAATASGVGRKDSFQQRLEELGYPSLPTLTLSPAQCSDLSALPPLIEQWVGQHGWSAPSDQILVVKPSAGSDARNVLPVRGCQAAAEAVQALRSRPGMEMEDVVVELYWLRERADGKKAVEFSVTVIEPPGGSGPVALLPMEVELWDLERQIFESDVELLQWELMKEGLPAEAVEADVGEARATAQLDPLLDVKHPDRDGLPNQQVRLHSPPRLSRKTVHHIRHAAAKLFTQLGLRDVATFDGFLLLDPQWEKAHEPHPDDPYPTLPDPSPYIMDILAKQAQERRAKEVLALDEYYDPHNQVLHMEAFDPVKRCRGPEATIHFFDVNPHPQLHPSGMLAMQAAEVGLAPANLMRNLVNRALLAAGQPPLPLDQPAHPLPSLMDMDMGWDNDIDGEQLLQAKSYNWLPDREDYEGIHEFYEVPEDALGDEEEIMDLDDDEAIPASYWTNDFTPPAGYVRAGDNAPPDQQEEGEEGEEESGSFLVPGLKEVAEGVAGMLGAAADSQEQEQGATAATSGSSDSGAASGSAGSSAAEQGATAEISRSSGSEAAEQGATAAASGPFGSGAAEELRDTREPTKFRLSGWQTERGQTCDPDLMIDQMFFDTPGFKQSQVDWSMQRLPGSALHDAAQEVPEGPLPRQKVWLLMGGDDSQRHASVAAGLHLWSKLNRLKDLQVELMLFSPLASGHNLAERRKNLLAKRVELKAYGFKEEDLPEGYQLPSIRYPPMQNPSVADRLVWLAPLPCFLRPNANEVAEQCERVHSLGRIAPQSVTELHKQRLLSQVDTQRELHKAGVQGVGSLWEGVPSSLPPAPASVPLGRLASIAAKHDAVVVNLVRGGMGADGRIERLLEEREVKHIGSPWTSQEACWDRMALQEALAGMEESGVYVTPRVELPTEKCLGGSIDPEEAAAFQAAVQVVLDDATTVVVKPNYECGGCGAAVLATWQDIVLYFEAYRQGWPLIRANSFSTPHPPIILPPFMPPSFVFEPFIPSDPICVSSASPGGYAWAGQTGEEEGRNPWVEVKVSLVGQLGSLRALPPSLVAWRTDGDTSPDARRTVTLTPVPGWCAGQEALERAMARAVLVAERLGLQGIAQLDTFMHCETGELYVVEVNTQPDMGPWAPLFAQAHAESGSTPTDTLVHLIRLALAPPVTADTPAPGLSTPVVADEDEELLGAVDLFGEAGEDEMADGAAGLGDDGLAAVDGELLGVGDVEGLEELYADQGSDILFKEEQDDELDGDDNYDEDDSMYYFSDR